MKKVFAVAAAFLILTGCGQPEQGSSSLPQDVPGSALSTESLNCRILYRMEESLLLVQEEEHMATEDLILLTPAGIEISDEQGNPAQPSQLEAGTTVRIEYDGSVLETYPCQLGGVTALQMTGTFESLLPFYLDRIDELVHTGIPVLLVAGEADDVVPYAENGAVMAAKMAAAGGRIHVILKPGVGHHPHSLEDPAPITAFMEAL